MYSEVTTPAVPGTGEQPKKRILIDMTQLYFHKSMLWLDMVRKLEAEGYEITYLYMDMESTISPARIEEWMKTMYREPKIKFGTERYVSGTTLFGLDHFTETYNLRKNWVPTYDSKESWKTEPHKRQRAKPGPASSLLKGLVGKL